MKNYIKQQIQKSLQVKQILLCDEENLLKIQKVCEEIIAAYKRGNKTLIAGNGGSAADAQHIAAEFVSRFNFDRPGLASIALTTDTSILTAIGNDYGYEKLFARQIEANGKKSDVFIGISTSGNSPNIIEAFKKANEKEIITVGLTSKTGGKMAQYCSICINVPSDETPHVQESHIMIGHIICGYVEKEIFKNEKH